MKVSFREFLVITVLGWTASAATAIAFISLVNFLLAPSSEVREIHGLTQVECRKLGGEWAPPYHQSFLPKNHKSRCFLEDAP